MKNISRILAAALCAALLLCALPMGAFAANVLYPNEPALVKYNGARSMSFRFYPKEDGYYRFYEETGTLYHHSLRPEEEGGVCVSRWLDNEGAVLIAYVKGGESYSLNFWSKADGDFDLYAKQYIPQFQLSFYRLDNLAYNMKRGSTIALSLKKIYADAVALDTYPDILINGVSPHEETDATLTFPLDKHGNVGTIAFTLPDGTALASLNVKTKFTALQWIWYYICFGWVRDCFS